MSQTASEAAVRIVARAPDAEVAERVVAEAYAAGATGLEEREQPDGIALLLYAPPSRAGAVHRAAAALLGAARVAAPEPVPDVDWSEEWKRGLVPLRVSPRLVVRPSFCAAGAAGGAAELVIDPGQAFGTGSHESTRGALEWLDALAPTLAAGDRLLDVGTGTGVLALAALRLAPVEAFGFDMDPLATAAARHNARRNGLAARLALFTGPLEALRAEARFALVLANLLRDEMLPLLPGIARRLRPGGRAVLSGLLVRDVDRAVAGAAPHGLALEALREHPDASGVRWASLLMRR